MRISRVSILVAAAIGLAACSGTEGGSPTAQTTDQTETAGATGTTTEPSESSPTAPSSESTANRPKDLDLAGVDVCGLFKRMPIKEFGVKGPSAPVGGESTSFPGSQDCYTSGGDTNLGLLLTAVSDEGMDDYVGSVNATVTRSQAAGYPLAVLRPADTRSCFGAVDVADGQMLYINYGLADLTGKPVTPQDRLCAAVPKIAKAALDALGD